MAIQFLISYGDTISSGEIRDIIDDQLLGSP